MEIQIENLKAKMRGVELNNYQKGLALDEFEKLIAHTKALEQQLHQCNVMCQLAISALESIDNPIAYIKSNMEEGETLNGIAVIMITEKPAFYQNIAKEALNKIANCT